MWKTLKSIARLRKNDNKPLERIEPKLYGCAVSMNVSNTQIARGLMMPGSVILPSAGESASLAVLWVVC